MDNGQYRKMFTMAVAQKFPVKQHGLIQFISTVLFLYKWTTMKKEKKQTKRFQFFPYNCDNKVLISRFTHVNFSIIVYLTFLHRPHCLVHL